MRKIAISVEETAEDGGCYFTPVEYDPSSCSMDCKKK